MGKGVGYGKVILVGEHFVVYGHKSIVLPLDRYISVEVLKYSVIPEDHKLSNIVEIARKELGLNDSLGISKIDSNLPESAGLGSSAALCVATLRAILDETKMSIDDRRLFEVAKVMENYFHGNSSGVDVYMAIHNKPIIYQRVKDSVEISYLKLDFDVNLGIKIFPRRRGAGDIIRSVREFKERNPEEFTEIEREYDDLFNLAVSSIEQSDIYLLSDAINKNHELLRRIGVSNYEIDREIQKMKSRGVLGAKISGAGDGGAVIGIYEKSDYPFDIVIKI
ncbi:MAG: mevalonate kinase [Candidatus Micrarchaeota archaeon]|nr:mevalonate kinase [Candidatus Micrarchaeota archaeon]MCX8154546.1 mevalonate kinase [Candidatus Micrarchaeota archaeon]